MNPLAHERADSSLIHGLHQSHPIYLIFSSLAPDVYHLTAGVKTKLQQHNLMVVWLDIRRT